MQKKEIFFSDRLKELRGEKTQVAIARELGVNQQTYARWEIGDRQPKLQDLASIALHFGVTTDWLLGVSAIQTGVKTSIPSPSGVKQKIKELKSYANQASTKADELLSVIEKMEGTL